MIPRSIDATFATTFPSNLYEPLRRRNAGAMARGVPAWMRGRAEAFDPDPTARA